MNEHLSQEVLQELADGVLPAQVAAFARKHLGSCPQCSGRLRGVVSFDRAVKRVPVQKARPGFTREVLAQLGIASRDPWAFRLLQHAGSVFAITIVLAVVLVGLTYELPGLHGASSSDAGGAAQAARSIASSLGGAVTGFTDWLVRFSPQVFGKGALGVSLMLLATVLVVAAVDWVVGRNKAVGH